jgi:hypothetical protein
LQVSAKFSESWPTVRTAGLFFIWKYEHLYDMTTPQQLLFNAHIQSGDALVFAFIFQLLADKLTFSHFPTQFHK